jgi:hypothetical protein
MYMSSAATITSDPGTLPQAHLDKFGQLCQNDMESLGMAAIAALGYGQPSEVP